MSSSSGTVSMSEVISATLHLACAHDTVSMTQNIPVKLHVYMV